MSDEPKNDSNDYLPIPIILLLAIAGIVIIFSIWNYYHYFGDQPSLGGKDEFGQLGDYIGGLLNPILSFCTVVLLIWSIQVQLKELKATRTELKDTKEIHEKHRQQDKEDGIRRQLLEQAMLYLKLCDENFDAPIAYLTVPFLDAGGVTREVQKNISLNDMKFNPTYNKQNNVMNFLARLERLREEDDFIKAKMAISSLNVHNFFTSIVSLIPILETVELKKLWRTRAFYLVALAHGFCVISDNKAEEYKTQLEHA